MGVTSRVVEIIIKCLTEVHVLCINIFKITILTGKSFFDYLREEITRGYRFQDNDELYSEKQKRVLTFMRTPRELEKVYTRESR